MVQDWKVHYEDMLAKCRELLLGLALRDPGIDLVRLALPFQLAA